VTIANKSAAGNGRAITYFGYCFFGCHNF